MVAFRCGAPPELPVEIGTTPKRASMSDVAGDWSPIYGTSCLRSGHPPQGSWPSVRVREEGRALAEGRSALLSRIPGSFLGTRRPIRPCCYCSGSLQSIDPTQCPGRWFPSKDPSDGGILQAIQNGYWAERGLRSEPRRVPSSSQRWPVSATWRVSELELQINHQRYPHGFPAAHRVSVSCPMINGHKLVWSSPPMEVYEINVLPSTTMLACPPAGGRGP